jgi:hypothetical protein
MIAAESAALGCFIWNRIWVSSRLQVIDPGSGNKPFAVSHQQITSFFVENKAPFYRIRLQLAPTTLNSTLLVTSLVAFFQYSIQVILVFRGHMLYAHKFLQSFVPLYIRLELAVLSIP